MKVIVRMLALVLALGVVPGSARAQQGADGSSSPVFSINARDIDYWEDDGRGLGTVLVVYLNPDRSDELADLTTDNVGETMTVLINGKYVSELFVQEPNGTGQLALPVTNEIRSEMNKELPARPDKKPTTYFTKQK